MEETLWNSLISNGGVVIKKQSNDSQEGSMLQELAVKQEQELIIDDPLLVEQGIPEKSGQPHIGVLQYPSASKHNLEINHTAFSKSNITARTKQSDRRLFTNLLTSWNIRQEIIKHLLDLGFMVNDLKIMTVDDITDLFSKADIVTRIRFRDGVTKLKLFGVEHLECPDTSEVETFVGTELQENEQISMLPRSNLREFEDIQQLLVQTLRGKQVLKHYNKYKSLSTQHHKIITDIVVDCLINRRSQVRLKCSDFKIWAERIVTAFPSERREIFFIKGSKGRHRGKLVDRYYNVLKKLRKKGLKEVTRNSKPTLDTFAEEHSNENIRLQLLTCNDWNIVLKYWNETFNYRMGMNRQKSMMEICNYWPNYNDQRGSELIEIDYNLLFPDSSKNNLLEDWHKYTDKWNSLMTPNTLDKPNDEFYIRLMGQTLPDDTKNYLIFMLLHTILPPICMINHVAIKRKIWQPNVTDSQNSVIIHVLTSKNNIIRKINEIKTTYLKYGLDMHPFIVIIGSDMFSYSESFVYVNDYLHKTDSFLKSLDMCFKIYKIFHLEFPKESFLVWQLIESLFYTPTNDVMDPSVSQILLFLNKQL